MSQLRLEHKTALVTGGAGFLGKTFALGLAAAGATVIVADLDLEKAEEIAGTINSSGGTAKAFRCDVANESDVIALVEGTCREFGRIDVLLNNAASKGVDVDRFFDRFEDFKLDVWREINSVNIDGMFLMAREVGRVMVAQGSGSIIQTSSIYGVVAPDQRIYEGSEYNGRPINTPAVYSMSKAGVIGLTKYLATYWGQQGIRVNTLTPGGISSGHDSIFVNKYAHRVPMGRMGNPDDLVGAIIFLASDESSYITGQNIIVDGGLTVW
jgi:NAD(P)-dependent dehydrogenase (short-subunit alcohol dehydrogenase family)